MSRQQAIDATRDALRVADQVISDYGPGSPEAANAAAAVSDTSGRAVADGATAADITDR